MSKLMETMELLMIECNTFKPLLQSTGPSPQLREVGQQHMILSGTFSQQFLTSVFYI